MKLAVSMWSVHRKFFHDGWNVLDFLDFCREHGFSNVELLDVFWKDQSSELPKVKDFLRKNGMTVAAYAVSNDFAKEAASDREKAAKVILNGIELAKELETQVVRVFAGDLKPGSEFQNSVGYIVEGFRSVVAKAEAEGIVLALENHGKLAGKGEQVRHIIREVGSNSLRSTFDMGNFILVDQTALRAFAELGTLVAHVHVKDFKQANHGEGLQGVNEKWFVSTVCGLGEIPISEVLRKIRSSGYDGYVSLEYEGDGDEVSGVLDSMEYLRKYIN
ncbi:sugar phosphate isomerase/epimerase [Alicyclobacillus sp. SO9]|uniref:sugar phosphate isomerase/epimerase family protein n=1 Tax=Alicyclobacillus sp. SO9 TaxID=2665646 RepID=UPI0018E82161|nr:sugar phosphate isomerase/epimerase [Alicyclobacillus sp. SO9]QQE80554.1 sugar phosphate isomerase/epimerase [Alicyclobacillus sp. SO9]